MTTYGIAVNSLNVPHRTGVERYLAALLTEMQRIPLGDDERVVLYAAKIPQDFAVLPRGWEWRVLPWSPRKGWTHVRLSWELWQHPPTVFFNPTHEVPMVVRARTKIVSTVHDLAFKRFPGSYGRKMAQRQEWAIRRAVKTSAQLLAISETTKHDVTQLYHVPEARVTVTPLGVDAARFVDEMSEDVLRRYRLVAGKYLLYVGRLEGKKNVATLVRGFAEFKQMMGHGHPVQLVCAGSWGFGRERIEAAIAHAGEDVRVLGFVPDEDLATLYKGALGFCFPSFYEGFGLPVLEAFAAGVPVLASTAPALVEVAGNAALFAAPEDAHAWAEHMKTLVLDARVRERLVELGTARVAYFSWQATAEKTWDALRVCSKTSRAK